MLAPGISIDSLCRRENVRHSSRILYPNVPMDQYDPGSIRWTNFAYAGAVGDVSDAVELPNMGVTIAQISRVVPAGTMDITDARDAITHILRNGKKLDMSKLRAGRLYAALQSGTAMKDLRSIDTTVWFHEFKDSPISDISSDSAVIAAVFTQKIGEIAPPIRGASEYSLLIVRNRQMPTDADFAKDGRKLARDMRNVQRMRTFTEWLQHRREEAVINDRHRDSR
jgi:hypothetical protein